MQAKIVKLHHSTSRKLIALKKDAEKSEGYRVTTRIHAVLLNAEGKTSGEISKLLHSPRSCVFEWLKNYDAFGDESFLEGARSGKPSQLNEKQRQLLYDIVDSGPVSYGFLSGVWTAKMIAQVILDEFDVSYHPRHVCRVLHDLNFSMQMPKNTFANADLNKQNLWKRYTYPNIKKKPLIFALG